MHQPFRKPTFAPLNAYNLLMMKINNENVETTDPHLKDIFFKKKLMICQNSYINDCAFKPRIGNKSK